MPFAWLQRKIQPATNKVSANKSESERQPAEADLQAQSLVKQLSSEILMALAPAQQQIAQLRGLSPTLTERMQPLFESIDRIHTIAKSAQAFSDNPEHKTNAETLDAATFVNAVISNRSTWFREKKMNLRHAISSVNLHAVPNDFYTFADELLLWCSDFSKEVALQLEAVPVPNSDIPRARLRLSAVFAQPQTSNQPSWQNTRWFVLHRLAKRLQAKTELRTETDRLILRISFPAPLSTQIKPALPTAPIVAQAINERLQGLRVLVISAHETHCIAVLNTLLPQGVLCDAKSSVSKAFEALHGHSLDAVIYDDDLPYDDLLKIRRSPAVQDSTAFLELHPSGMQRDFQPSTSGAFTTGHVSLDAVERSLASALSFEIFKTM